MKTNEQNDMTNEDIDNSMIRLGINKSPVYSDIDMKLFFELEELLKRFYPVLEGRWMDEKRMSFKNSIIKAIYRL